MTRRRSESGEVYFPLIYMKGVLGFARAAEAELFQRSHLSFAAFTRLGCQPLQFSGSMVLQYYWIIGYYSKISLLGVIPLCCLTSSCHLAAAYASSVKDAEPVDWSQSRLSVLAGNRRDVSRSQVGCSWQIQVSQAE